ncbi:hypothetical protein ACFV19_12570 [Streptomyces griseoluteus]|uniref:hypothetical protein n=1 Tax=Streptomyces griseoluteus TaxID=29306 RepID=UPI0036AF093C
MQGRRGADRLRPWGGAGEHRAQQRHGGRHQGGAADAEDRAGRDQGDRPHRPVDFDPETALDADALTAGLRRVVEGVRQG